MINDFERMAAQDIREKQPPRDCPVCGVRFVLLPESTRHSWRVQCPRCGRREEAHFCPGRRAEDCTSS